MKWKLATLFLLVCLPLFAVDKSPTRQDLGGLARNKIRSACLNSSVINPNLQFFPANVRGQIKIPGLILDEDFGNDPGDVFSLCVAHALADNGEIQLLAVGSSVTDLNGPGCIDAINTYYGRQDIPIGINKGTTLNPGPYPNLWNVGIASLWPNSYGTNGSTAEDATTLYRRILASRPDKSVTIVANGQLANLEALRTSSPDGQSMQLTGAELIAKKVKTIVVSAGQYATGFEYNMYTDPTNASNFVNKSVSPILFNGYEVGNAIVTGSTLTNDVSVSSPERYAADVFNTVENDSDGRESWDQIGTLLGGRGTSKNNVEYWKQSSFGNNLVTTTGTNTFTAGSGPHRYIIQSLAAASMVSTIDGLMAQTPRLSATRPVSQAMIATNLVTAIWKLDEASGGPWIDSVNSLSMTNITGSTITRVTGATNGANTAARFNGTTSGMSTPHNVLLNGGNSPYSITALVKFAVTNADQVIFNKQQGTAVDYFLYLPSGGLARPAFFVYDGAAVSASVGSVTYGGTTLSTNVWYQIEAFVEPQYSGNNARLGIRVNNGTIYYSTTSGTPGTNTSSRAAIGINCSSFAGQVLNGDIDYVQFKKTINGKTESTHMYNSGTFKEFPY